MSQTEGVYAGHTYAEPYLRIALKAEHQLKQTLALLVQLETTAAQTPTPNPEGQGNRSNRTRE